MSFREQQGYAMIYSANGRTIRVNMDHLSKADECVLVQPSQRQVARQRCRP
ncbi:MAG: hypothetical protein H6751_04605 [Candidatus Omnitrophica bacterium]|nr:hypothetical protein [Candidatus Omnitrophota bacterium]